MNARFFLDTNIFVYSFDHSSAAKNRRAAQLIRQAVATGKGIVSYQVVQEFCNLALRRFAQPMTVAEAELSCRSLPALAGNPVVTGADFTALRLTASHRLSRYDALIVTAAIEGGCGILYSEDLQHGQRFGDLKVENPFVDGAAR